MIKKIKGQQHVEDDFSPSMYVIQNHYWEGKEKWEQLGFDVMKTLKYLMIKVKTMN